MPTKEPENYREALMELVKNLSPIDKQMIKAVINEDGITIQEFLEKAQTNPQVRNRSLMIAAREGHIPAIKLLNCTLEDIGRLDLVGYAGHASAENKQALLDHFWSLVAPNATEPEKASYAAIFNQCAYLETILEKMQPYSDRGQYQHIPLAHYNHCEGSTGITPFMFTEHYGHSKSFELIKGTFKHFECYSLFLKSNENSETETPESLLTKDLLTLLEHDLVPALAGAAKANRLDSLRFLLTHGVNSNAADDQGWTALMDASLAGNTACVELLLQHGANSNLRASLYITALTLASSKGHAACVELLLQHGANPNWQDVAGGTALSLASDRGHTACVELLLQYDANPNLRNSFATSVLDSAVGKLPPKCIALLSLAMNLKAVETPPDISIKIPSLEDAYKAHPEIFKTFVKDILNENDNTWPWITEAMTKHLLEDPIMKFLKSSADIKRNSILIAQGSRSNTGFFNQLPTELLIKIASLTGDREAHNTQASEKIAFEQICPPN